MSILHDWSEKTSTIDKFIAILAKDYKITLTSEEVDGAVILSCEQDETHYTDSNSDGPLVRLYQFFKKNFPDNDNLHELSFYSVDKPKAHHYIGKINTADPEFQKFLAKFMREQDQSREGESRNSTKTP